MKDAMLEMRENTVSNLFNCKSECCGCSACYAVCPTRAISMIEDEEGFLYPSIDEKECTKCRMCIKVCPFKVDVV